MTAMRVLIVDDVIQVRQELKALLSLSNELEIVGEASNGLEAIRQVAALQPDVVLMDLEMPVLDGYQATPQIKARFPACRVLAFTIHDYQVAREKAEQAGIDGFIPKGVPLEGLVQAILHTGQSAANDPNRGAQENANGSRR